MCLSQVYSLGWFICMLPRCILYLTHLKLLNTFASYSDQETRLIFDSGLSIVICLSLVTKSNQFSSERWLASVFFTSVTFASVQGVFISCLAQHNTLITKWPIVTLIVTLVLVVYWCLPISQTFYSKSFSRISSQSFTDCAECSINNLILSVRKIRFRDNVQLVQSYTIKKGNWNCRPQFVTHTP